MVEVGIASLRRGMTSRRETRPAARPARPVPLELRVRRGSPAVSSVAVEHQHPAAHHPDQVGELLRFLEIVGAKQDGAAFGAKPGDQAAHVARRRRSSPRSARPERSPAARAARRGSGRGAASFPWTRWRRGGPRIPRSSRRSHCSERARIVASSRPYRRPKLEVGPSADPVVEARRLGEQSHPRPQLGAGPVRLPAARCPRLARCRSTSGAGPAASEWWWSSPPRWGRGWRRASPPEPKGKVRDRGEAVETAGEVSGFDHGTTAVSWPSAVSRQQLKAEG